MNKSNRPIKGLGEAGAAGAGRKVTVGNEDTGRQGTIGRGTIYNPNSGEAVRISGAKGESGGVVNVNGHVIADKDGNYYRPDGQGGWEQITRPPASTTPAGSVRPAGQQVPRSQTQWAPFSLPLPLSSSFRIWTTNSMPDRWARNGSKVFK